jgi:hypothetical protein
MTYRLGTVNSFFNSLCFFAAALSSAFESKNGFFVVASPPPADMIRILDLSTPRQTHYHKENTDKDEPVVKSASANAALAKNSSKSLS